MRTFSGLAHALKLEKIWLIRMLSSSSQVSLDNPSKVIGRELLEQKMMHESSPTNSNDFGKAILYESMDGALVEPMEEFSMTSTTPVYASLKPRLLLS